MPFEDEDDAASREQANERCITMLAQCLGWTEHAGDSVPVQQLEQLALMLIRAAPLDRVCNYQELIVELRSGVTTSDEERLVALVSICRQLAFSTCEMSRVPEVRSQAARALEVSVPHHQRLPQQQQRRGRSSSNGSGCTLS